MNIELYLDETRKDLAHNPLIILRIEGRQAVFAKQLASMFKEGPSTAKEDLRKLRETGGYSEGEGYLKLTRDELEKIQRWEKTTFGKSATERLLQPLSPNGAAIIFEEAALWLLARSNSDTGREFAKVLVRTFISVRDGKYLQADEADLKRLRERNEYTTAEVQLKATVHDRGLRRIGTFISAGDKAYYAGKNTRVMHIVKDIPQNRPLADFDSSIEIRAKTLAKDLTDKGIKSKELQTESEMTNEYVEKNKQMRKMLTDSGIYPEKTLKVEDIKEVKKRTKQQLDSNQGLKKIN